MTRCRWAGSCMPANVRRASLGRRSFLSIRVILPYNYEYMKLPKRVEDIVWTNLFWRPRLYLYLPLFCRTRVLYLCLMQALILFPPLCVSFSLERRPISAPGSCPLRFGCGTRPWADEACSREMSTSSKGKASFSCPFLTSRRWGL